VPTAVPASPRIKKGNMLSGQLKDSNSTGWEREKGVGAVCFLLGLRRPPWTWVTAIDGRGAKKFSPGAGDTAFFTILHKSW
jgi:hypothetical protein